ncbi:dihydrolipoyl dehydrogenase [Rhodococcus sp. UNC23MFCrub1.1]|uniref:dihydrolipoyl dehydrogenase n=1 Tax=Rhodococcus sp. UNC23MFCrub1.1 TaxID=1449068 RepID=UPI0004835DA1|nr:dihydrolipoyl dehydrogenase [Rhodococcus sp. UNC23MFCrub1.1]
MTTTTDVLIIGGGSGGYACAFRASQLGLSVTLIDDADVGGTCLHRGCIPTKALLHAAEVADSVRESADFGIDAELHGVDLTRVNAYKSGVVDKLFKGLQGLVRSHKINHVQGRGVLIDAGTVDVNGEHYRADNIVLATGSFSRILPGIELSDRVITSDQAMNLSEIPRTAIVLGGGVIGVEFASIWTSFGTQVCIVEALPRLVPAEDEWSSKQIERAFRKRKIDFKTGVRFKSVAETETGVVVTLENGTELQADILLVAVGRGPRTDDAGFAEAGVRLDRGFVITDERLRTSIPNVYAVGDIVPGLQLAHRGFQQGIFVAEEIAGLSPVVRSEEGIPRVTYSNPEVASVGLTEVQARERYGDVTTVTYDLAGNGKSQILRTAGGVRLIRSGGPDSSGPVVGIHMVGARVGELIGEAQLINNWEAHAEDVAPHIHAHPTQSEALGEAHLALAGTPLHSHS